jgi:hypothetical protein
MGPKNGLLERRVWQFYTICDKNQLLKIKNRESYSNSSPQILGGQHAGDIGLGGKVSRGLYGEISEKRL